MSGIVLNSDLSPRPQSKQSIHSGHGALSGGGVKRLYKKPNMGECALKVENRIGVVMIFCLATLATILFVYGLYSEVIHDDMIEFINKVEHEIEILPKEERVLKQNKSVLKNNPEKRNADIAKKRIHVSKRDVTKASSEASDVIDTNNDEPEKTSNGPASEGIKNASTDEPPSKSETTIKTTDSDTSTTTPTTTTTTTTTEATSPPTEESTTTATTTTEPTTMETTTTTTSTEPPTTIVDPTTTEQTTTSSTTATTTATSEATTSTEAPTTTTSNAPETTTTTTTTSAITNSTNPASSETLQINEMDGVIDASAFLLERLSELEFLKERFLRVQSAIWTFVVLNVMALILITPLTYLFHTKIFRNKGWYRAFYMVSLIVALVFFLVELIKLIHPLLFDALNFPGGVDRLFSADEYLAPPLSEHIRSKLVEPLQAKYVCVFDAQEILVNYGIQEQCLPKLKNYLLPAYTVFLLILIDLVPLLFPFLTFFWMGWLKNWGFVWQLRRRFEANQQKQLKAIPLKKY